MRVHYYYLHLRDEQREAQRNNVINLRLELGFECCSWNVEAQRGQAVCLGALSWQAAESRFKFSVFDSKNWFPSHLPLPSREIEAQSQHHQNDVRNYLMETGFT